MLTFVRRAVLLVSALALAQLSSLRAELGLAREVFGVWDREGGHAVNDYPYTRGQSISMNWADVHLSRYNYSWALVDAGLQTADANNQLSGMSVGPVGGLGTGQSHPLWMSEANGGGVPFFGETYNASTPTITPSTYTYGYYLDPDFKTYFREMVEAFAQHVRQEVASNLQARVGFVRVNTGATGDEEPYENGSLVPVQYQISPTQWREYRLWVFELYRKAFQEGPGPVIPLLFSGVEPVPGDANIEWNWILANVKGGFGIKHGGQLRGHQLSESESNVTVYKPLAVDSDFKFFSRNEMDQTWTKPYFKLNVPLNMYWAALEQLNVGMSVWDWSGTCLENADGTLQQFFDNGNFVFTAEFFNKWAAELDPATAGGGFCVFHEGLDSFDTQKFPTGSGPGQYGNASWGNTARYTAICAAYAAQGAKMDDLNGATMGSVAQRDDTPGMIGFNDAGWKIHPGNYDRFITQLDPDNTSKALWRVGGPLTTTSHPYNRFARRSDTASGKNTMYFDINDNLLPSIGQRVQINVTYRNDTAGQFLIKYDAAGNSLKTLTVDKTGLGTGNQIWATASFEVTDWVFGNRQPTNTAPSGSDLQLVNVGPGDTIYHGIELIKMVDISVGIIGSGTVTGRNNTVVFSPLPTSVMEAQRLELKATPAPGWQFTGWSGALTGTTPYPFLFPTKDTRLTATFVPVTVSSSLDDFNSVTWSGGNGWSGDWTTAGLAKAGAIVELNGGNPIAQITRILSTPLTSATLSFDWDLDRISTNLSESGTVEVFNTVTNSWQTVWSQNSRGGDVDGTADMLPSGSISLTGTITRVRFTLNANTSGDTFLIDNLAITGTPVIAPSNAPQFSNEPIGKAGSTIAQAYTGQTLAGSATDPNGNPLTFSKLSKLSGGSDWLTISPNGGLAGQPTLADVGLNRWTVQISSSGGSDTATLLINVVNPGPNPPSGLTYPSFPTYTKGSAIVSIPPASIRGSEMRYVASPRLPKGLYLNSTTGVISGTPTEVAATSLYTITATNADGSTTASVNITVIDIAPSALTYSGNPAIYKRGEAIAANVPANSGGDVVSYAVSPTLPSGLTLNSTTGVISGTPLVASLTPVIYRVTASNTGGSTFTDVSIEINEANSNSTPIAINDNAKASPYPSTITVPTTTGTITKVTVQLKGLNHTQQNDLDILLVGPSGQTVVLMSDVGGNADAANADLTFDDASLASLTTTAASILTGTYKPTNNGPTDVFSAPAPATATYGTTLSVFNGTNPTGTWNLYIMDDRGGKTGTLSGGWNLSFEIAPAVVAPPSSLSYFTNPATYTMGSAITINAPTSSGGAVTSYVVSPALPAGLTLNPSTGVISGTPTAVVATGSYTVTASNSGGSATASVSITVNDAAPTMLAYSSNPATYTKGTAITANTPSSSGGAVISYSVSPALPAGLMLNSVTGVISGAPTVASLAPVIYRITATNTGGSTFCDVSIAVNDTAPSSLAYSTTPAIYITGVAITANTPTSSGGAVASYSVSPALPTGLTFNTSTGEISGTPSAVTATASYAVTASNSGGSKTALLSIAVVTPYTAWSTQYNLVQGPNGDDDSDGNSNILEFVTGMVPTNATSVFKTAVSAVPGQLNQFAISFSPITSGRTYTVKSIESLTSGTWSALTGSTTSDVGSERTVIDTQANGGSKFYRVEISIP